MPHEILDEAFSTAGGPVYASFSKRLCAWVIDVLITMSIVTGAQSWNLHTHKDMFLALIISSIPVMYKIYAEGMHGTTIGKRMMGVVIVQEDGSDISFTQAMNRNGFYTLIWIIACVNTVIAFSSPEIQYIHDLKNFTLFKMEEGTNAWIILWVMALIASLRMLYHEQKQTTMDKQSNTFCLETRSYQR